ncbi:hypothetical protein [Vibrio sinaloensis]|uniref:hypothetical protein n=1 Tax=Photobacterium sp. (strain ATCC 43367) TaxID=379097 RepID=UPI0022B07DFA|nr:hypothetical protein [Vibrio sinaloensis]MCZ4293192.1 hypothetical protein [Vibrio sinaloensis]
MTGTEMRALGAGARVFSNVVASKYGLNMNRIWRDYRTKVGEGKAKGFNLDDKKPLSIMRLNNCNEKRPKYAFLTAVIEGFDGWLF